MGCRGCLCLTPVKLQYQPTTIHVKIFVNRNPFFTKQGVPSKDMKIADGYTTLTFQPDKHETALLKKKKKSVPIMEKIFQTVMLQ